MLYLITNINYLFLLKKINCLRLYELRVKIIILLTKLEDFSRNIKYNLTIFRCYNLLLKNLSQRDEIKIYCIQLLTLIIFLCSKK